MRRKTVRAATFPSPRGCVKSSSDNWNAPSAGESDGSNYSLVVSPQRAADQDFPALLVDSLRESWAWNRDQISGWQADQENFLNNGYEKSILRA
jgi:hypothetical protein